MRVCARTFPAFRGGTASSEIQGFAQTVELVSGPNIQTDSQSLVLCRYRHR
jgi:hypothetical protein